MTQIKVHLEQGYNSVWLAVSDLGMPGSAGKSALPQPLPLTLGSDLSGIVEVLGSKVTAFQPGDPVFGVTNSRSTGAYAEFAVASAGMIANPCPWSSSQPGRRCSSRRISPATRPCLSMAPPEMSAPMRFSSPTGRDCV
jgi:hypothetical protein